MDVDAVQRKLRRFAAEREWEQFHTPKNIAMAVATEAGELLGEFQWLTATESQSLSAQQLERVRQEMADVAIHILRLADLLGLDIEKAIQEKLAVNAERYPIEKARGNARKYTEFDA